MGCRCIQCSCMTEVHSQSPQHCPKCSSRSRGADAHLQHATPSPIHFPDQAHIQAEEAHGGRSPRGLVPGSTFELRADVDMSTLGPKQPGTPSAQHTDLASSEAQRRVPVFMGFSPAKVNPLAVMAPPVKSRAVRIMVPPACMVHQLFCGC